MTRPLARIDGTDPDAVMRSLRDALTGEGPALFPAAAGASPHPLPEHVPRATALVVETSGSTGAPKRVALSTDALLASAAASAVALGGAGQWLLAVPAHYIAGAQVLVRSIAAGTDPVLLPAGHFEARAFAAAADRLDADLRFTSLVPAQLARVVEAAASDAAVQASVARFARILVGGQAAPQALIDRAASLGIAVTRTYGSSETAGGCVYDGVPIGDTRAAIVDGVVELSGSSLALGYLDDDDRTRAAFPEHDGRRWYRTGDLGEFLPDGRLRVTGRADDVIISGGEKVSLGAVERIVRSLPGLEDAVVLAAPSPEWGQVPVVVAAPPAAHAELPEIREAVAARSGAAARPARLELLAAFPVLSSGKPDRRALARMLAEG
ncbi:AMP-binding protein [Rathayibacter sp. YIM 133350]|uniref:AMP-binding protein n=1 Tax=Rathayibacter sp. YIM 133350 TaxID=3131992 RepID=UPI00307E01D0